MPLFPQEKKSPRRCERCNGFLEYVKKYRSEPDHYRCILCASRYLVSGHSESMMYDLVKIDNQDINWIYLDLLSTLDKFRGKKVKIILEEVV